MSAEKLRPPVVLMIQIERRSDKMNPADADRETVVGHGTAVVTEGVVKLEYDEQRAFPV